MASPEPTLTTRTGRVRRARRLATRRFRAETGQFLAEGPQAVREALALTGVTHEVFATAAATERHAALHDAALDGEVPWSVIDDDVLEAEGVTDFSVYLNGGREEDLALDFWVDPKGPHDASKRL